MTVELEYKYPIGAIVYVKNKAKKGELQKVCIKNVNLVGHPTKNYSFNYQDTTNRIWLEEELIWGCDAEILVNQNIINYKNKDEKNILVIENKNEKNIVKIENKSSKNIIIEKEEKNKNFDKKRKQINANVTIEDCHNSEINNEIPEYLGENKFKTKYSYNNETLKVYLNGQRLSKDEFETNDAYNFTLLSETLEEDQIIIDYKKINLI